MTEYLFSYGSNNPTQLSERLNKDIDVIIPAYYPQHRLAFGSTSKKWLGGVATMIPFNDSTYSNNVYGYLTKVSSRDLKVLDKFEAVNIGKYVRKIITVIKDNPDKNIIIDYDGKNDEVKAYAYFLTPEYLKWVEKPSEEYLQAIYKTQSQFWKNEILIINIIKAENGELIDEWSIRDFHFKTMISKLIKKHISDPMQQNITFAKFKIIGLTDMPSLKQNFYKENKKLIYNIDDVITKLGYLPFKKNLQKEIEKELTSRLL